MQFREEVIFTGRVPSAELKKLMASAMALTFVPHFEGFGIPVIEAMSAGTPVICSNTTSLPEVGGEAVLYVNPGDVDDIVSAMNRISSDAGLRNQLRESGFRQKEKFNWETSAVQLWEAVQGVLANVAGNKNAGHAETGSKE
jgi:glycosyltransferase involved in cell wall biosynthesis